VTKPPPRPKFRPALKAALHAEAAQRGRTHNEVALEFAMQRFLARVFAAPDSPWVLKGGTSLLMRLTDARHSRDLDRCIIPRCTWTRRSESCSS
jgi:nucleotidyltransferase AbiEii toxin of type IV toxin-antitoxin system